MKHVISVSLGSSKRNKKVNFQLGDELITLERIGCDGNEQQARSLFAELDGKVDALGVGGVELYVRVAGKRYPLRSGLNLVKDVTQTPVTDGGGLKFTIERNLLQLSEPELPQPIAPRRAMMPLAADRYGMAESLHQAGFDIVFCDLMFGLGLPFPVKGLRNLRMLAAILLPIVGLMPISMLYPTGQNQEAIVPKFEKWYNYGPVIAGDFQYIRRHLPQDLSNKYIFTNTTTQDDVEMLRARGLPYLITCTPRLDGRSFGTNVLEAALIAYADKGRPLTDAELSDLITEFKLVPQVLSLT